MRHKQELRIKCKILKVYSSAERQMMVAFQINLEYTIYLNEFTGEINLCKY